MAERKLRFEVLFYVGLFLIGLILFSILRVPSDRLARLTVAYVEAAGYDMQYEEMGGTFLPGFRLYGVKLFAPNENAPTLELSTVAVRTALLPLLTGKAGVLVAAEGYGGEVKANIATRGSTAWARGEIKHVDLETVPAFRDKLKVPVRGSLDANFDLELMSAVNQSVGNIDVTLGNFNVGQGQLMGLVKFPGADFGDIHGALIIENGKVLFDRFAGDGQDVKAVVEGDITLREPIIMSPLNLNVKLTLSQRIEEALGYAFPLLGLTKSPQGEYIRRVGGTLGAPR